MSDTVILWGDRSMKNFYFCRRAREVEFIMFSDKTKVRKSSWYEWTAAAVRLVVQQGATSNIPFVAIGILQNYPHEICLSPDLYHDYDFVSVFTSEFRPHSCSEHDLIGHHNSKHHIQSLTMHEIRLIHDVSSYSVLTLRVPSIISIPSMNFNISWISDFIPFPWPSMISFTVNGIVVGNHGSNPFTLSHCSISAEQTPCNLSWLRIGVNVANPDVLRFWITKIKKENGLGVWAESQWWWKKTERATKFKRDISVQESQYDAIISPMMSFM